MHTKIEIVRIAAYRNNHIAMMCRVSTHSKRKVIISSAYLANFQINPVNISAPIYTQTRESAPTPRWNFPQSTGNWGDGGRGTGGIKYSLFSHVCRVRPISIHDVFKPKKKGSRKK